MKILSTVFVLCIILFAGSAHAADVVTNCEALPSVLFGQKTGATLRAKVTPPDGENIVRVWAEIIDPDNTEPYPAVNLLKTDAGVYENEYTEFTKQGDYMLLFYAETDQESYDDPCVAGLSKREPTADDYEEDDTFSQAKSISTEGSPQSHNFHDAGDTDWKKFYARSGVTYTVEIANNGITNGVIEIYDRDGTTKLPENQQDTSLNWTCPENADGIYFVKLYNLNSEHFGEAVSYTVKIKIPLAGNEGYVEGRVTDTANGKYMEGVTVVSTGRGADISDENGEFILEDSPGDYILTAKAQGYEDFQASVSVREKEISPQNICMNPAGSKGNVNGDEGVDLKDAVLALQIIAGKTEFSEKIYKSADVNCDGCIGLEEVIYILREISGM